MRRGGGGGRVLLLVCWAAAAIVKKAIAMMLMRQYVDFVRIITAASILLLHWIRYFGDNQTWWEVEVRKTRILFDESPIFSSGKPLLLIEQGSKKVRPK